MKIPAKYKNKNL